MPLAALSTLPLEPATADQRRTEQLRAVVAMAGALTATLDMTALLERALQAGADFVKIFPCSRVGGAQYIKALKGPFPQIPLVPTGGVNLNTAAAFIECGAFQCGFCTSGFLLMSTELLAQNPRPSEGEIRDYLSGNLCRCATYPEIIRAVKLAAERTAGKEIA